MLDLLYFNILGKERFVLPNVKLMMTVLMVKNNVTSMVNVSHTALKIIIARLVPNASIITAWIHVIQTTIAEMDFIAMFLLM